MKLPVISILRADTSPTEVQEPPSILSFLVISTGPWTIVAPFDVNAPAVKEPFVKKELSASVSITSTSTEPALAKLPVMVIVSPLVWHRTEREPEFSRASNFKSSTIISPRFDIDLTLIASTSSISAPFVFTRLLASIGPI